MEWVYARLHCRVPPLYPFRQLPTLRLRIFSVGIRPLHHLERPIHVYVLSLAR